MPPYFWLGVFKGLEKLSILILEYYLRFFNSGRLAVVVPLTRNIPQYHDKLTIRLRNGLISSILPDFTAVINRHFDEGVPQPYLAGLSYSGKIQI